MKYFFPCIIEKQQVDSVGNTVVFPTLNMRIHLSPKEIDEIKQLGYKLVLRKLLLAILADRDKKNIPIPISRRLDQVVDSFVEKKSDDETEKNFNIKEEIIVHYQSKRKCNFCETVLPPITKFSFFFQVTAGTINMIGTLQLSKGIIPMSDKLNKIFNIIQSILTSLLGLWIMVYGPNRAFMADFGATLDDLTMQFWRKITGKKNNVEISSNKNKSTDWIDFKIKFFQYSFTFLVFVYLWTKANADYQTVDVLRNRLNNDENAIFPSWLITGSSWTCFILGQLNDPLEFFNLLMIGFATIAAHFAAQRKTPVLQNYQESHTENWLTDCLNTEQDEASIDMKLLQGGLYGSKSELNVPLLKI